MWCACLVLLGGAGSGGSFAQDNEPAPVALPPWVVLVLQPISAERVRPVTGVVISASGLVIVPLDFATPGDQIIVLDGGTDIIVNGRAAQVRQQFPQVGLTVLSAPGLKRQPASLSSVALQNNDTVRLAAFPPAEMISQGAAPLWVPAPIVVSDPVDSPTGSTATMVSIAAQKNLPNVTGPLIDACGNLVGFSSADGVQSMETSKAPAYLWKDDLLSVLRALSVELPEAPCPAIEETAVEELADSTEAAAAAGDEARDEETVLLPTVDEEAVVAVNPDQPPPVVAGPRWLQWLGLLGVLVLAGLAWLLFKRRAPAQGPIESLLRDAGLQIPRAMEVPQKEASQADCILEIIGRLPNGSPFQSSCEINSAAIDVVIGRGAVDIAIDSQGVQREHARLSGSGDLLTITDLGSSRGTWINRVPCLKGEIMFVGPQDTIFLGDVSFQIIVRPI